MDNAIEGWSFFDVANWLRQIGLTKYADLFIEHEIDGEVLLSMTESDLCSSLLHIVTFGDIRKFGVNVEKLKAENKKFLQSSVPSPSPKLFPSSSSTINNLLSANCQPSVIEDRRRFPSEMEYDNDIEAALNGAAFVGGYDEDVDVVYSDYDDDEYERDEKVSIPPMDEETELKVSRWVENVNVNSELTPAKCSYLSESERRHLMLTEPKLPKEVVLNDKVRITHPCVDKFSYNVSPIEIRMPITAPKSANSSDVCFPRHNKV